MTRRQDPTAALTSALVCLLRGDPEGAADGLAQVSGWVLSCAREAHGQARPAEAQLADKLRAETARADKAEELAERLAHEVAAAKGREVPDPMDLRDALGTARLEAEKVVAYLAEHQDAGPEIVAALASGGPLPAPPEWLFPAGSMPRFEDPAPAPEEPAGPSCGHRICSKGPCLRADGHAGICLVPHKGQFTMPAGWPDLVRCEVCGLRVDRVSEAAKGLRERAGKGGDHGEKPF